MDHFRFHPKRTAFTCAVITFLVFLFSYQLIIGSGLIPGANKSVDQRTKRLENAANRRITVEGAFLDHNGDLITQAEEPGTPAVLLYDAPYAHIIGYNSNMYGTSGLRGRLYDNLYYGGKDGVGATVTLTTTNDLQQFCYDRLGANKGCIIVMNAETGALMAIASRSDAGLAYTVNDIDKNFSEYASHNAFFLNPATTSENPGGSTFKAVTSTSLVENGMEHYVYDDLDGVFTVGSASIHNYGNAVYGAGVDLQKALNKSCNTYFASAGVAVNAKNLYDTATRFLYGQTIELDFATLKSTFDLGNLNDRSLVARTAFGQGKVTVSPLQVAMTMGAIMNDGVMMKPYILENITDDGKTILQASPAAASNATDKETARKMQGYLHNVALSYGFEEEVYGRVYAKTGTADQSNGRNCCYYLMGVETETGKYVILVNYSDTYGTSSNLKKAATDILAYLVTM